MISTPAFAASGDKIFKSLKMDLQMALSEPQPAVESLESCNDSGNLSAWLLKRKSGGNSHFFSSTNRRFFTLDFGAQILFYKRSVTDKKISLPISFRSILSVQPLTDTVTDLAHNGAEDGVSNEPRVQRVDSKASLASSLRKRMPSFVSTPKSLQPPKEQHGFVVRTCDKSLELLCSSKMEADQWIAALHKAMLLGGPKMVQSSFQDELGSSRPTTACSGSSSLENANRSDASEPLTGRESANPADEYVQSPQKEQTTHTPAMLPPKVPKRPPVMKARNPEVALPTSKNGLTELIVGDGVAEYSTADARLETECEAWGVCSPQKSSQAVPRYHDRAEGLSWQERLARLDFSDDEDENDPDENQGQALADHSEPPVKVDDCQPFTADLSDGDEE